MLVINTILSSVTIFVNFEYFRQFSETKILYIYVRIKEKDKNAKQKTKK